MFTKDGFKEMFSEEVRVLRHLATKIEDKHLAWRPSDGQRSIQETMQYLCFCGIGPAQALLAGDWGGIPALSESFAGVTPEGFDAALADQETQLHALLDGLGDADLEQREAVLPWGQTKSLGKALYLSSLRFLSAYRLQLFVFLKSSGEQHLGVHQAWLGMDPPSA